VCDGFSDCPGDEDEKKCTALIDDEPQEGIISESNIDLCSTEHLPMNDNHSESQKIAENSHLDQEAIESSIIHTTTLYVLPNDLQSKKLTNNKNLLPQIDEELSQRKDADKNDEITVAVSSREISSSALRNALTENNPYASESRSNRTFPANVASLKEIESYNYNNKGYLSVRKNGKWGKLCLNDTNDPSHERQRRNTWSIEDLAKAACKAVTYQ